MFTMLKATNKHQHAGDRANDSASTPFEGSASENDRGQDIELQAAAGKGA